MVRLVRLPRASPACAPFAHAALPLAAPGYQRRAGKALTASGSGARAGGWKFALPLALSLTHSFAGRAEHHGLLQRLQREDAGIQGWPPPSLCAAGGCSAPPPHSSGQDGVPLPVLVTAYKDRSFDFVRSCLAALQSDLGFLNLTRRLPPRLSRALPRHTSSRRLLVCGVSAGRGGADLTAPQVSTLGARSPVTRSAAPSR
jgi:hypothetical protein